MRLTPLVVLSILAAVIAGCGSGDGGDGRTVAVTTGIWADVTEQIAGEDASVEQIIPDGTSPHDFQLSARDRAEIEDSVLLVYNGAELEAGIPIGDLDATAFAMADHAGQLRPSDPHLWMDPTRVAEAVPALAEALAKTDPDHAEGYRDRAANYVRELEALDQAIRSTLAAIPAANRQLVTSHDALGYFADRYGFQVIATPFPASGPESEPSAQTIAEVEEAIRTSGVPTVFAQDTDNPEILEGIASRTGVRIETGLPVEAPGAAGSYIEMLRRDAEIIGTGLSQGQ
ncbi:MAG TPA: metal ABC transporter substrate-binding protein [Solirubrobacterales bacterium]|nr:metal ABC transporter substrate-binding protein [Solirubrobacterales bacterium]